MLAAARELAWPVQRNAPLTERTDHFYYRF